MFIKPLTREIIKNLWNHTSKIKEYLRGCYETGFPVKDKTVLIISSGGGFGIFYGNDQVSSGMNILEKGIIRLLFHYSIVSEAFKEIDKQKVRIRNALYFKD